MALHLRGRHSGQPHPLAIAKTARQRARRLQFEIYTRCTEARFTRKYPMAHRATIKYESRLAVFQRSRCWRTRASRLENSDCVIPCRCALTIFFG